MAMCPNCRLEVGSSRFCPHCGTQVGEAPAYSQSYDPAAQTTGQQTYYYEQPEQPVYQQTYQQPVVDSGSFGWAVLGFFIPLIGLILFLVWKDTKPRSAKQAGMGALVGVVLGILGSVASTCAAMMYAGSM